MPRVKTAFIFLMSFQPEGLISAKNIRTTNKQLIFMKSYSPYKTSSQVSVALMGSSSLPDHQKEALTSKHKGFHLCCLSHLPVDPTSLCSRACVRALCLFRVLSTSRCKLNRSGIQLCRYWIDALEKAVKAGK